MLQCYKDGVLKLVKFCFNCEYTMREKCPYSVSLHIQSKCGKTRTRKTPNTDTFHAVIGKAITAPGFYNNLHFHLLDTSRLAVSSLTGFLYLQIEKSQHVVINL